jgi:hypothetical protein
MQSILLEIPPPTPATSWAAIALGVTTIIYVAFIRPLTQKKKDKDPLSRPPTHAALAQQRAVERDMGNLLVELSEMSRQMTGQLDTRAAKLEALLREADEKIALLRSLGGGPGAAGAGGGGPQGVLVEAKLLESDAVPMPAAEDPTPIVDPRHAEVYDLADEGQSAQEIARQTGRPRGEVELILALRGR